MLFWQIIAALIPRALVLWAIERYGGKLIVHAKQYPLIHLPNYMNRYGIWKNFFGTDARIHEILRSDTDRHLHDHPWSYISIILKGGYWEEQFQHIRKGEDAFDDTGHREVFVTRKRWHSKGSILVRRAESAHRLTLPGPTTSLFITFGKRRAWGFHTEDGWVYWKRYVDPSTLSDEELRELHNDESDPRPF